MTMMILLGLMFLSLASGAIRLQERFAWNAMDYAYPDEFTRAQAIGVGTFIPENNLPVGIEIWRNKMFVSVPRWRPGIPATLNYISLDATFDPSPKLIPYPSWAGNELANCENGLNTVYRIKADECGRLWVLDTGTFGIGNTTTNPCPYAINVFDLNTDRRIRRYVLRPEDINANTFIANIAIDVGSSCEDTHAYLSDELGYGLISYSWQKNRSWRFEHGFFFPDPLRGDFNIAGLNFQWNAEGIFGITLSPPGPDGFKTLYFSPIASHREFAVSTRILRDETKVENSYQDFQALEERGPNGHLSAKVMHSNGIMLFNLIDQNAIGCWNSAKPYRPENLAIVDKDDVGLVFPSDVKIDANENVWILSDRMPVFLEADLDFSDVNFRIYTAPLSVLVQDTVCDTKYPQNNLIGYQKITTPSIYNPTRIEGLNLKKNYLLSSVPNHLYKSQAFVGPLTSVITPYQSVTQQASVPNYKTQLSYVAPKVQAVSNNLLENPWWLKPSYQVNERYI